MSAPTSAWNTHPRIGEFFAPLPLAAVALLVVNDTWLKPAFHNALTGKLSDVAVCFMMPAFSPGPTSTRSLFVGSFFKWIRELL